MDKLSTDVIFKMITRLIGDISPTGHHEIDMERCENIREYKELMKKLIDYLGDNMKYSNRHEQSIKELIRTSRTSLANIWDHIDDTL